MRIAASTRQFYQQHGEREPRSRHAHDFDLGLYKQTDTNFNADLSWTASDTLNIGFGGEFRKEEFEIGPAELIPRAPRRSGLQHILQRLPRLPGRHLRHFRA